MASVHSSADVFAVQDAGTTTSGSCGTVGMLVGDDDDPALVDGCVLVTGVLLWPDVALVVDGASVDVEPPVGGRVMALLGSVAGLVGSVATSLVEVVGFDVSVGTTVGTSVEVAGLVGSVGRTVGTSVVLDGASVDELLAPSVGNVMALLGSVGAVLSESVDAGLDGSLVAVLEGSVGTTVGTSLVVEGTEGLVG